MTREHNLHDEIKQLAKFLSTQQQLDGTWRYCFENGTIIDAYVIILLRSLNYDDEALIQSLHQRIALEQHTDGYWSLYSDEKNGNLASTIDNYYALLYSGYSQAENEHMKRAQQYIQSQGGMSNSKGLLHKAILAITGQIPWPNEIYSIPIEIVLLPSYAPINLYKFSGYSRVHLIPMLILAKLDHKFLPPFQLTTLLGPYSNRYDQEYVSDEYAGMLYNIQLSQSRLIGSTLNEIAMEKAVSFMLERIEDDGTLYSYASSTILMIFALLALGVDARDSRITKAIEGLLSMRGISWNQQVTIQNSPSTIWDTALISYALQQANIDISTQSIHKANAYLLSKQQHKKGDWSIHNDDAAPGGWGFSESNSMNPDIDDTTAALRAIYYASGADEAYQTASSVGLKWVLSMQNKDGGWPAFEKDVNNHILTWLKLDGAKAAAIDPSTADLTGRTLDYLGKYTALNHTDRRIKRGISWLLNQQLGNGSWYGKWGICYIYGTWAAITGLKAVGMSSDHKAVKKAVKWLLSIQNIDGGWGESCNSDRQMRYIPLNASTPSQTAWALDALIAVHEKPTTEINKGIRRLMALINENEEWSVYPTGAGLPGSFYVHYHSYRYIYPLLALSHYRNKYELNSV